MIPNITRGGNMAGVMAYLVGPGRHGEHTQPHLIAGSSALMAWHGHDELGRREALEIGQELDRPRTAFGVRVTRNVQVGVDEHDRPVKERRDAHVWHCSLALHPDEEPRDDELWATLCEQFVQRMGFDGPDRQPCRWAAVHHGLAAGGNDHVHVVVGLVHEDGTKANVHHDRSRAQTVAGELEREFGLRQLESRDAGLGSRASTPAERGRARTAETDRQRLARLIRGCAAASADEAEFVRRVRQAGLKIAPRFAAGRDDVVTGYKAAERPPAGGQTRWRGGGSLARDLTLPRLRDAWPSTPQSAAAAVAEWRAAGRNQQPAASGRETQQPPAELWAQYTRELAELREQLAGVPDDDRAQWAHVARDTAGAFAAWSMRVEGDQPGPLAATADILARSAQLRAREVRPRATRGASAGGAAMLLASVAHGGKGPVAQVALLRQLVETVRALYDAHEAAGDAQRAKEIAVVIKGQLATVTATLPSDEPATDAERDAAEAARLARTGQLPLRSPGAPVPATLGDQAGRRSAATPNRERDEAER